MVTVAGGKDDKRCDDRDAVWLELALVPVSAAGNVSFWIWSVSSSRMRMVVGMDFSLVIDGSCRRYSSWALFPLELNCPPK